MPNIIDIDISLTSPLYEAYPDNKGKDNVCRTMSKPVVDGATVVSIPYFGANGLRGALRRFAANRVMARLCENEARIPADLYLGLNCGASSASPDSNNSIEELLRAKRNVYMGLFGGAARLLPSRYEPSDINPVIDLTVRKSLVPARCVERVQSISTDSGAKTLGPRDLTDRRTHFRVDDLFRVLRPDKIMRFIPNAVEAVAEHQSRVLENREARTEGATKSDVANIMSYETVAEGTPMHFRITLAADVSAGQVGLMLYGLRDFIRENALGGMTRVGWGRFRVEAINIQLVDELGGHDLSFQPSQPESNTFDYPSNPVIQSFLDAADEGLAALTIEEMNGYYLDSSAEAKAKKRARKASGQQAAA